MSKGFKAQCPEEAFDKGLAAFAERAHSAYAAKTARITISGEMADRGQNNKGINRICHLSMKADPYTRCSYFLL